MSEPDKIIDCREMLASPEWRSALFHMVIEGQNRTADTMMFSHLQPRFTRVHRRSPLQWDTLGQSERGRR